MNEMNQYQKVIEHFTGPALVIAGPGSGKTRTVVRRAARLLERKVAPENITLVTFTRKAAQEMAQRLHNLVGPAAEKILTATFHSLAYQVIREDANIRVLPADRAKEFIAKTLQELNAPAKIQAKTVQGAFSRVRNATTSLAEAEKELKTLYAELEPYATKVWEAYQDYKERKGYLDFDDLLHHAVFLLENDSQIRARWQERARFLTVDEYQDTNLVQFRLLRLLLGPEENIMAVGDPNQAIYSWRGADYRLILEFRKHFPHSAVYELPVNYRSHKGIVEAAKAVIRNNQEVDLPLQALRDGPLPQLVITESRDDEALFVAEAAGYHIRGGTPPEEIAVLFRSLAQTRLYEAKLRQLRIPYEIVGGRSFWERREVRLYLTALTAATGDPEAKAELLSLLVPNMGPKRAAKAVATGKYPEEARETLDFLGDLEAAAKLKGRELAATVERAFDLHRKTLWPYFLYLAEGVEEIAWERWGNMREAVDTLFAFAAHTPEGDLQTYLNDILLEDSPGDEVKESGGKVKLMTYHAAKGLEFQIVIMPGLVEGYFPFWRATQDPAALKEERRLYYVGLTRAKEHVYLSLYRVGDRGPASPSRFVKETPTRTLHYNPRVGFQGEATATLSELADLF
jgi:DNA helicase-2/ATP-dependent DNA helicase PcrA